MRPSQLSIVRSCFEATQLLTRVQHPARSQLQSEIRIRSQVHLANFDWADIGSLTIVSRPSLGCKVLTSRHEHRTRRSWCRAVQSKFCMERALFGLQNKPWALALWLASITICHSIKIDLLAPNLMSSLGRTAFRISIIFLVQTFELWLRSKLALQVHKIHSA